MTARLVGRTGKVRGIEAAVTDLLTVGSGADSDLLIESRTISRRHAQILRTGTDYYLEDLGSRNGTFLNGQRVKRFSIRHLDVVSLGPEIDLIFLEAGAVPAPSIRKPSIRATIMWIDGPLAGRVEDVSPGSGLVVGRRADLALPAVSRRHAALTVVGDRLTVEDLGSANGTSVNGKRISAMTVLSDGDELSFGDRVRCRVAVLGPAALSAEPMDGGSDAYTVAVDEQSARGNEPILELPRPVWPGTTERERPADPLPVTASNSRRDGDVSPADHTIGEPRGTEPSLPPTAHRASDVTPSRDATEVAPRTPAALPSLARPHTPPADETFTPPKEAAAGTPAAIVSRARIARGASEGTVKVAEVSPQGPVGEAPRVDPEPDSPPTDVRRARLVGPQRADLAHGTYTVGRHPDCDLQIDLRDVGRKHAQLRVSDAGVTVDDLGSANGTFVDDLRVVGPRLVPDGSRLRFATVEFSVTYLREEE